MTERVFCAGYGSLVHEEWAKASVPSLEGFSFYRLDGYRRVFGKVHPFCIYRDEANFDTLEVAACFIEPAEGHSLIVSGFSVPEAEWPQLCLRECDYAIAEVELASMTGGLPLGARVFTGYGADTEMPKTLEETYSHWPWLREKYLGQIYRPDILPSQPYLKRCLQAHSMQGEDVLNNFLDQSFLADRVTSIRTYLEGVDWGDAKVGGFEMPQMPKNESTHG